jgi:phosphoribosylaminoimidazole-succinocarboxamide synthase
MDIEAIRPYVHAAIREISLPGLPNHYSGKVRENYDLADGRRLLVATDRISAFDTILGAIPLKGQVLTQLSRYWFEQTAQICPNHVLAYPDPNVVVAKRLSMLPVEIVVRGYLAGTTATSILTMYRAGKREMYGVRFPDGLRANEKLPSPIITPTTKGDAGVHDVPLTPRDVVEQKLLTKAQWDAVSTSAFALFAKGQELARRRGLILADTKYEFGIDAEGQIVLGDEIHTPDSSRFWLTCSYGAKLESGQTPESFDKDVVRNWVSARCNPYKDPIPTIPDEFILRASQVYIEAFETISGLTFALPEPGIDPVQRIRENVKAYLGATRVERF